MAKAKKGKKPLFDKRCPGSKMIVYGAIFVIISAVINAYMSWTMVVGVLLGAAESSDVMGYTVSLCLQVALSLLVAIDGINNRNLPQKARSVMINSICVAAISIFLLVQGNTITSSVVIAGLALGGSALMATGAIRNRSVLK